MFAVHAASLERREHRGRNESRHKQAAPEGETKDDDAAREHSRRQQILPAPRHLDPALLGRQVRLSKDPPVQFPKASAQQRHAYLFDVLARPSCPPWPSKLLAAPEEQQQDQPVHRRIEIVVLLLLTGVAGCSARAKEPPHFHSSLESTATASLKQIQSGSCADTAARFDQAVRTSLDAPGPCGAFEKYQTALGRVTSSSAAYSQREGDLTVVRVPLALTRGRGEYRVTYHPDGRIAGIFFLKSITQEAQRSAVYLPTGMPRRWTWPLGSVRTMVASCAVRGTTATPRRTRCTPAVIPVNRIVGDGRQLFSSRSLRTVSSSGWFAGLAASITVIMMVTSLTP